MIKKNKYTIAHNESIRDTIKKMDVNKLNSLIVLDDKKKVIGIFTAGDFRRAVLGGLDVNNKISLIINDQFKYLMQGFSKTEAKKIFKNNDLILNIPILNKKFQLIKIINRSDFFFKKPIRKNINIENYPVVIMAGGKGTRLDPFTRVLPKPLIPYGNDPIIKVIMDSFKSFGLNKFYISINEKSSMIKSYFYDHKIDYEIKYIEEKKPLGTAGSLKLLEKKIKNTFFVINSDVLIHSHYPSIIEFHKKNSNDLTLISSMRNYKIPYGVCTFDKSGKLKRILEKPSYDHFVNTGLYVIEPRVLKLIPVNAKFDMSKLINKAKENNMKIGVFPISEHSWSDMGEWTEYKKSHDKLKIY